MLTEIELANLPEDSESLKALLRSVWGERNHLQLEHLREQQRANELYLETLRLHKELLQLKKLYCGPRADRLQSEQDRYRELAEHGQVK